MDGPAQRFKDILRPIYARARLTTTLTTKGMNKGGQCSVWWTGYRTELLSLDAGGQLSSGLSRRMTPAMAAIVKDRLWYTEMVLNYAMQQQ